MRRRNIRHCLLPAALLACALSLTACSGDDGVRGPEGPAGPAGPVTSTKESCAVCHADGNVAGIANFHTLTAQEKPVVSDIDVARSNSGDPLTDLLTVTFHVADKNGDGIEGLTADRARVYMADIVPAGTATVNVPQSTWDSPYLEMWAEEHGDDAGVVFTDLTGGNYSFQMVTNPGDIITLAPEGDLTHTQRIYVRADTRYIPNENYNRTMGVADFTMPSAGADTGVISGTTRTIVVASACSACHNDPLQEAAHGAGYQSPQVCNMCHSPIGENGDNMQASGWWFASLIHRIHDEQLLPGVWPGRAQLDASGVTYPQSPANCEVCHFDAGQDMADAYLTNPTAQVCGSCHTNIDFAAGVGHSIQTDNSSCANCHGPGADLDASIYHAAAIAPAAYDTPEFTVNIALSPDANADDVYEVGEAPEVTVTLTPTGANPAVDYTAVGAFGATDGQMYAANLYVYGPRAHAKPVLTAAAAAGSQSNSLLSDATDPQVATDATGFKYQLSPITDDMAAGTYMIRFEGGDYGWGDAGYVTSSNAVVTFQIGTATVEKKVAGDACVNCHGETRMHVSGAHPHNAPFDTDACLGCHDYSGNYATPLLQRVHAVHSAAGLGADGHGRAWDGSQPDLTDKAITFPQAVNFCQACHTSGDDTYMNFSGNRSLACLGCHGDKPGVADHLLQKGGETSLE